MKRSVLVYRGMNEIKSLTNGQIIALLRDKFIIGFDPAELRVELKRRNREAFKADLKRRNKDLTR